VPLLARDFGSSYVILTSRAMMYRSSGFQVPTKAPLTDLREKNSIYFLLIPQKEAWMPTGT